MIGMSQTMGTAGFVGQAGDLAECRGGTDLIGRDEVQAWPASITDPDAAMVTAPGERAHPA
jgi:hypothetical protein